MEIRELLQEYGYNAEETPIVTGSALYALEVNFIDVNLLYASIFLGSAVSDMLIFFVVRMSQCHVIYLELFIF